jgi:predicted HicB family RNase H-like nuclease
MIEYKGYISGPIDVDPEDGVFSGTIAGLADVIHFEGSTPEELLASFQGSIDEYLKYCEEVGKKPDKSFSGKMLIRSSPGLHRKATMRAESEGISLSAWVSRTIEAA